MLQILESTIIPFPHQSIGYYLQILKSNMTVNSCQWEIIHKFEKLFMDENIIWRRTIEYNY